MKIGSISDGRTNDNDASSSRSKPIEVHIEDFHYYCCCSDAHIAVKICKIAHRRSTRRRKGRRIRGVGEM